ncbi:hypothetical protein MNBD_GAMMA01-793 [hydrothermal vent metagenome]|uniref:Sulfotransferase domain-containing protein n=1 Tax=hydrothermal vent metagenome TaxID=652676 RepID=A0A3B0VBC7_9ZZZZ
MAKNNSIDFIVVGAQKSGTTSLYQYLKCHPEIFLPDKKELEFFYRDELFSRGYDWYIDTFFKDATNDSKIGEVSPQYMFDESIPYRIKSCCPDVKVIMILRSPIERAYSHYKMSCRRSLEDRSFSEVVESYINRDGTDGDKISCLDPNHEYIRFGEYGRILSEYLKYFERNKILIIFTDDLKRNAQSVMNSVFGFIGVSGDFMSSKFDKTYHVGGSSRRFIGFHNWLKKRVFLRKVFRFIISDTYYSRLRFWYETELSVAKNDDRGIDDVTKGVLRNYYMDDVRLLEKLCRKKVCWTEFLE